MRRRAHSALRHRPVTHSGACVRGRAAPPPPCGRPWWPSGRETHGGACAPIYSADRSVSRKLPPLARSKMASSAHSAGHCRLAGDAPARRQSTGRAGGRLRRLIRDPSRPVKSEAARHFDRVLPARRTAAEVEIHGLRCLSFARPGALFRSKGIAPILQFIAVRLLSRWPWNTANLIFA